MVEFTAVRPPVPLVTTAPPPLVPAVLPLTVEFSSNSVPVKLGRTMPPPVPAELLFEIVLPRMTTVFAVKPTGGAADAGPKKYNAPPPVAPFALLPLIVLFSSSSEPPEKK
jgi:hypothetical protein